MGGTVDTLKALAKVDLRGIDVKHSRTADTKQTVLDMLETRLQSMEHNDNADEYDDWRAASSYLMEQVDSAPQDIAHLAAGSRHSEQKFVDADSSDDEEETFVDASDGHSPVEGEQEHPVLK
ncbi:hypothetical protein B9Z65_6493 [Elsinoe australis]|uniref:Uncharacterized protein n=1 Tax=Elsinoe australis TaxID=40998 RepID=A0A2P8A8S8_9PEZI|nr:hypothetical protein B9Z65_6493 [Elsinoe australis]